MARKTMHFLTRKASRSKSRLPPLSPKRIEFKVPMCCEGCEENVREELTVLEGVGEINIDVRPITQKVIVVSHYDVKLEPCVVLNAVKKVIHGANDIQSCSTFEKSDHDIRKLRLYLRAHQQLKCTNCGLCDRSFISFSSGFLIEPN